MPLYESTFITRHDMSTQQVEKLAETFTDIVKENGGEVPKTELWGLKTLAYRIKKNRKGYYVHFNIDAPSAAVREVERNLRLNEDVLRYLTVRVDELDPNPSPIMQSRAGREDRSRRGGGRGRGEPPERPAAEKKTTEQPAVEKEATEQPAAEKKTSEPPAAEKKTTEQPAVEKEATEPPTTEKKTTEQPAAEKETAESANEPADKTSEQSGDEK